MFLVSKCKGESHLGLCTKSVLANRMPPRIGKFWQILRPNKFLTGSRHPAAAFCLQLPKMCTDLDPTLPYILISETYSKFVCKNKLLVLGVCLPQACSSAGRRITASKITLEYYQRIVLFPQQQIWCNALYIVNWIQLRICVHLRSTQPYLNVSGSSWWG